MSTTVTFTLENSGMVRGAEVSQVYLRFPTAAGEPPLQLKGFAKTTLGAGAKVTVTVLLAAEAFGVWSSEKHAWVAVTGEFGIAVGSSSADLRLNGTVTRQ
jgi:beta-glucosidase